MRKWKSRENEAIEGETELLERVQFGDKRKVTLNNANFLLRVPSRPKSVKEAKGENGAVKERQKLLENKLRG